MNEPKSLAKVREIEPVAAPAETTVRERHRWKLGKGVWCTITITGPGTLTSAEVDRFMSYVNLLPRKPVLK